MGRTLASGVLDEEGNLIVEADTNITEELLLSSMMQVLKKSISIPTKI